MQVQKKSSTVAGASASAATTVTASAAPYILDRLLDANYARLFYPGERTCHEY